MIVKGLLFEFQGHFFSPEYRTWNKDEPSLHLMYTRARDVRRDWSRMIVEMISTFEQEVGLRPLNLWQYIQIYEGVWHTEEMRFRYLAVRERKGPE